jgi:hypothetical protein
MFGGTCIRCRAGRRSCVEIGSFGCSPVDSFKVCTCMSAIVAIVSFSAARQYVGHQRPSGLTMDAANNSRSEFTGRLRGVPKASMLSGDFFPPPGRAVLTSLWLAFALRFENLYPAFIGQRCPIASSRASPSSRSTHRRREGAECYGSSTPAQRRDMAFPTSLAG